MIVGIGIDIIEHIRIKKIFESYGNKFLERYFSDDEIEYSLSKPDPVPHIAARFAVKEAVIKSLGIKNRMGLLYKQIEVSGKSFGKKELKLYGNVASIANEKCAKYFHFTISHSENYSIAMVILES